MASFWPTSSARSILQKFRYQCHNPLPAKGKLRCLSTKYKTLKTTMDYTYSGMCEVSLNNVPGNMLNLEIVTELSKAIKEMENSTSCRGFILGSAIPKQFCRGIAVSSFFQPNVYELKEFYHALQQLWLDLYGTRLATVAAIKGNALGYGCLLALCCDYRVSGSEEWPNKFGFNETEFGLSPPPWYRDTVIRIAGSRQAELALSLAKIYTEQEAVELDFIDEIVPAEEVRPKARQELERLLQIPDHARVEAKIQMRNHTLQRLHQNRDVDASNFMKTVTSRPVQMTVKKFLASLHQRKVAKREHIRQRSRLM